MTNFATQSSFLDAINHVLFSFSVTKVNQSSYFQHVKVCDFPLARKRALFLDNNLVAKVSLNSDQIPYMYLNYFHLAQLLTSSKKAKRFLFLGGGAYILPRYVLKNDADSLVDVVEIDPFVTRIAEQFFGLTKSKRLTVYHQDAVVYIKNTTKRYDLIFIDVIDDVSAKPGFAFRGKRDIFASSHVGIKTLNDRLTQDGVLVWHFPLPVIGDENSLEQKRSMFKRYIQTFGNILVFTPRNRPLTERQGLILLTQKDTPLSLSSIGHTIERLQPSDKHKNLLQSLIPLHYPLDFL